MSSPELYSIITEDDDVLADNLTLDEAEKQLCYYLQRGEDCYIAEANPLDK
jgi:hypothetical protein